MAEEPDVDALVDNWFAAQPPAIPPAAALQNSLGQAQDAKPDYEAELRRVATETGVPLEALRPAPEEAERAARVQRATAALAGAPVATRFMTDASNARLASDDVDTLTGMEKAWQVFTDYARSLPAGALKATGSGLRGGGDFLTVFDAVVTSITGNDGRPRDDTPPAFGFGSGVNAGAARREQGSGPWRAIQSLLDDPRAPLRGIPQGLSLTGQGLGFLGGKTAVPEERQTFGTGVTEGIGQIGGQALLTVVAPTTAAALFAGQGADQMGDQVREAGKMGTPEGYAAMGVGALVTMGSEKLAIDALLNRVPPALKSKVLSRIADLGIAAATEGVQETAEGVAQNLLTQQLLDPSQPLDEGLVDQAAQAATAAGVVRLIINTLTPGRVRGGSDPEQFSTTVEEMAKLAAASPLRQRDPQAFEAFVAEVTAGGTEDIFIDARTFAQAAQSATPEEQQILAGMASMQGLAEAAELGQDIKMPVAEFAGRLAGTSLAQTVVENARANPFELSRAQATAARETQGEELKAEAEKVLASAAVSEEFKASAKAVEDGFVAQLATTNRFSPDVNKAYAKQLSAFYTVYATKLGISPEEFYQRYPLQVRAQEATGTRPLRQAQEPLTAPPVDEAGNVRLTHWGKKGKLKSLSPDKWGENWEVLGDDEKSQVLSEGPRRIYFGVGVGRSGGYTPEFGLGQHRYETSVPANKLYDYRGDPKKFLAKAKKAVKAFDPELQPGDGYYEEELTRFFDEAVRDAGFLGFFDKDHPAGMVASLFNRTKVDYRGKDDGQEFYQRALAAPRLEGAPETNEPYAVARQAAADYMSRAGLRYSPPTKYVKVDTARAKRIADAFDEMKHDPTDPAVAAAYEAMIAETMAQWQVIKATGLRVEFIDFAKTGDPYAASPRMATEDVRGNNHLWVFPTDDGFGSSDADVSGNPLLELTDEYIGGRQLKANDVFRIVHDYFGHIKDGNGFRAGGEENAWQSHAAMYSPLARRAMTVETRGQNSWVNYGPHGETNRTATAADTVYADQKIGLLPDWVSEEGYVGGADSGLPLGGWAQTETAAFKAWFGDSKVVDAGGKPLVVYHGRTSDFEAFVTRPTPTWKSAPQNLLGAWFTDNPARASNYADDRRGGDNVVPAYLSVQKLYQASRQEIAFSTAEEARTFRALLEAEGYDGVQVDMPGSQKAVAYVVFEPTQIKSAMGNDGTFDANDPSILSQNGDDRGSFDPNTNTINLLRRADLSTFLHESGHFYLNVLGDLANQTDTPAEIKQDMETALRWFGVPDLATWRSMSLDEQRPHHEKWARGFEAYLFEGRAPSLKLRELFQKFKSWLKHVYTSLTDLNVELTDEVRGVFDRMLASAEEIKTAEEARGFTPLFATKPEGMTDDEWVEYQRMGQQATADAADTLETRSLRDMKWLTNAKSRALKELQKGALARRKIVHTEVTAEVEAEPVYRAQAYLKRGLVDGEAVPDARKLSIPALKSMYEGLAPELQDWTKLGYGKFGMLAEDGLHPDEAAELLGFPSGQALVEDILNAEPMADKINGLTDQRMLERYGDLTDPVVLARAAEEAVHNDARIRFVAAELNAMNRALGRPSILNAAVKEYAAAIVSRLKLKELKPHRYTAAALRAGKAAEKALAKGNQLEAVTEKRNQLINIQAAREVWNAREEADKALALFTRIVKAKDDNLARSRNMDLVNAARAILAAYGIGRAKNDPVGYLDSVKTYDPALYADLEPAVRAATTAAKPLAELSYEELQGLRDTVNQLWTIARRAKVIEIDGQQLEIDTVTAELGARLDELGVPDRDLDRAPTDGERRLRQLSGLRASTRRVEHWAQLLGQPFTRYIWNPVAEAADAYRAEKPVYMAKFLDLLKPIAATLKPHKIAATEIGYTFSGKSELLHAVLHTGNLSNKTKLLVGRRWGSLTAEGELDSRKWEAFVARMHAEQVLTKADYDFAQGVWDLLEETKPLAQKAHHAMFGRYFAEVTADPVATPFGEYRGGYVPALTDAFLVQDAALRAEQEAIEGGDHTMFPSASRGFTKSRVENYTRELALDLRLLPQHIDKVLKFAHMGPPVQDVLRLLRAKGFSVKLEKFDPVAQGELLLPWLNRSVRQAVSTPMKGEAGRMADTFFRELRKRTGLSIMFGNLVNALQQFTGFSVALVKVKPYYLRAGVWNYLRNPTELAESIAEVSPFMAQRMSSQTFEINQAIDDIVLDPTKLDQARDFFERHGYFLQHAFQNTVDIVTWQGAYEQATAEGLQGKDAIRAADAAVRQSQGAMNPEDLARIEAGYSAFRLFTQFMTYFNNMANLLGTEYAGTIRDAGFKGAPRLLYVYFFGFAAPALLADLIVRAMRGEVADDEDDGWLDEFMSWFFGAQTRTAVAMVPLVGPAAMTVFNTWNDKPYDDRIANSPSISTLESAARSPKSVYDAVAGDGSTRRAIKDSLSAVALATGLPVTVLAKPLGYAADVAEGEQTPTGPVDAARGAVSGTGPHF